MTRESSESNESGGLGLRPALRWLASLAVSGVLVYWLLDPRALLDTLTSLHLPSLGLFTAIYLVGVAARVWRYWLLLERRVAVWPLTLVTLVRNFAVDLLPARIGSLSYIYFVTARAGAAVEAGLSSFLLAFVLDVVAIAPLLLLALLVVGSGGPFAPADLAVPAVILLLASVAALFALAPCLRLSGYLLDRATGWPLVRRLPRLDELGERLAATAGNVRRAADRGTLIPLFLISLLIRLTKFGGIYVLLQAVLAPHGYAWGEVGFFRSFLGIAGAELSATLPIHSIAGLGTYEAAWTFAFSQLGLPTEIASVTGFASHLITQVHDYSLGLIALLWIMRPGFREAVGVVDEGDAHGGGDAGGEEGSGGEGGAEGEGDSAGDGDRR